MMGISKRTIRKTLMAAALAGAVVAVGAGVWLIWFKDRPVSRFGIVQQGVLYRGAQPDEAALREIIRDFGIRTVVNLRGSESGWRQTERDLCRSAGVQMVDVELNSVETAASGIREFLTVVGDPRTHPVFAHCEAGSKRTGFAVAAYRIVYQNWTYDLAVQEAQKMRFNADGPILGEYDRLLRLLASGADWQSMGRAGAATSRAASVPAR